LLLFCNIGWMARYQGLARQEDRIVGGGRHVKEHGRGFEVCNFLPCDDGNIYGHVEVSKKEEDQNLNINRLSASKPDKSVKGVTVVWTATHPREGGRRVIGWYREAEVFRTRQFFPRRPSGQHRADGLPSFRIRALCQNACLLPIDERKLTLLHKPGWLGQKPYWFPNESKDKEILNFFAKS
jgi:hypothetical protein